MGYNGLSADWLDGSAYAKKHGEPNWCSHLLAQNFVLFFDNFLWLFENVFQMISMFFLWEPLMDDIFLKPSVLPKLNLSIIYHFGKFTHIKIIKNIYLCCICFLFLEILPMSYFRILEQNLMTYARQMFFMTLLYDTDLEVTDKAQMYLEIFGNTQLSAKAFQVL